MLSDCSSLTGVLNDLRQLSGVQMLRINSLVSQLKRCGVTGNRYPLVVASRSLTTFDSSRVSVLNRSMSKLISPGRVSASGVVQANSSSPVTAVISRSGASGGISMSLLRSIESSPFAAFASPTLGAIPVGASSSGSDSVDPPMPTEVAVCCVSSDKSVVVPELPSLNGSEGSAVPRNPGAFASVFSSVVSVGFEATSLESPLPSERVSGSVLQAVIARRLRPANSGFREMPGFGISRQLA